MLDPDEVRVTGSPRAAPEPYGFECVRHEVADGTVRLALSGELDVATSPELDQALRDAQLRARIVTLDLRDLTFMECSGLSVVLTAATRARASGDRLRVVRGPASVERLFLLVGADHQLEIV